VASPRLEVTGNNVTQAARILGIGVATLWRKIRKHSIHV
jgi:transcriptional regulator of acetoin/glycerol metabolism